MISSAAKHTLSVREVWGFDSRAGQIGTMLPTTCHRCDVSSKLCCQDAKPLRWVPPLDTRFGVITASIIKISFDFFERILHKLTKEEQTTFDKLGKVTELKKKV